MPWRLVLLKKNIGGQYYNRNKFHYFDFCVFSMITMLHRLNKGAIMRAELLIILVGQKSFLCILNFKQEISLKR